MTADSSIAIGRLARNKTVLLKSRLCRDYPKAHSSDPLISLTDPLDNLELKLRSDNLVHFVYIGLNQRTCSIEMALPGLKNSLVALM